MNTATQGFTTLFYRNNKIKCLQPNTKRIFTKTVSKICATFNGSRVRELPEIE